MAGVTTGGHRYVFRLRQTGDGTEVRQIDDWSRVTDPNFEALGPFVSREQLMGTLDRLAAAAETLDRRAGNDVSGVAACDTRSAGRTDDPSEHGGSAELPAARAWPFSQG